MSVRLSERLFWKTRRLQSPNIEDLDFYVHWATHGLAIVFRIGSCSGIIDWITHRSKILTWKNCALMCFCPGTRLGWRQTDPPCMLLKSANICSWDVGSRHDANSNVIQRLCLWNRIFYSSNNTKVITLAKTVFGSLPRWWPYGHTRFTLNKWWVLFKHVELK